MAAQWLQDGGVIDLVPLFVRYAVGASLVERCVRLGGAKTLWATATRATARPAGKLDTPSGEMDVSWREPVPFLDPFAESYGVEWRAFIADWENELRTIRVPSGVALRLRWMEQAIPLRSILLSPMLSKATLSELDAIAERVDRDGGALADVARADELLRRAPEIGTEIDIEAVTAREETLKRYALCVEEPRGDVVNVLRLGMLARRGAADVQEYATAFADAVNVYTPIAVGLPWDP